MTGTDWMREVPIPEPPRRDAAPMVVFSASGGAGSSVVSALVAGYWADRAVAAGWVDAAPGDGDMISRLGGTPTSVVQRADRLSLWRPGMSSDLVRVVTQAQDEGLVPFVDAGTTAVRRIRDIQTLVADGVVPVLVIGLRPDLFNRARTVISRWEDRGILDSAVIVLNAAVPGIGESVIGHASVDVLERAARDCVGMDYDPTLGTGLSLSAREREYLELATVSAVEAIAVNAAPRRLAVAQ